LHAQLAFALRISEVIHLLLGKHGEILRRLEVRKRGGQIYENAKRKDSSRMEAQIIRYENAKTKKL